MTKDGLRAAIQLELKAIHDLTELGAPHSPTWVADIVQDHCRAVKLLSRELFHTYGVRLHYHEAPPCPIPGHAGKDGSHGRD